MSIPRETIEAPPDRRELAERWEALRVNPAFEDLAARVELTEWGEIVVSVVTKTQGLLAPQIAITLVDALGQHAMAGVGVATDLGVRVPDVAWCSDSFLAAHPEQAPLSGAPELCVQIAPAGSALPKLREKAEAYVRAGAVEAWILFPQSRQIEVYGRGGLRQTTSFVIDPATLLT